MIKLCRRLCLFSGCRLLIIIRISLHNGVLGRRRLQQHENTSISQGPTAWGRLQRNGQDMRLSGIHKANGLTLRVSRWRFGATRLVQGGRLVPRLARRHRTKPSRRTPDMLAISSISGGRHEKKGTTWTTAQYNLMVGVRGSAIETAWEDRLTKLGVNNTKTCDVIRLQAIRKTLELSDVIL